MISGIGIDIVHVDRIRRWVENPSILERFFHPAEIETARSRNKGMALSLAARFAAKEAFGKALGTGLAHFALREVAVVNDSLGRPHLQLEGSARREFERHGGGTIHVSMTHEGDNAVAVVILEKGK
ncbi:MAG: holo-ACP synthase [Rectinema sp.]